MDVTQVMRSFTTPQLDLLLPGVGIVPMGNFRLDNFLVNSLAHLAAVDGAYTRLVACDSNGNLSVRIGNMTVATINLADLAVTEPKLADGAVTPGKLGEISLAEYSIDADRMFNDTGAVPLTGTGGAGLAHITGNVLVHSESVRNGNDSGQINCWFTLPPEYKAAQDVKLAINCHDVGVGGTVLTRELTIGAYHITDAGGVSANLYTGGVVSFTDAPATHLFVIDPVGLQAGDRIFFQIGYSLVEGGDTGTLILEIGSVKVQLDRTA